MRAGGLLLMLVVSLTACLEPTLLHCPNDTICPIGKVCSPLGGCVVAEQLAACSPEPVDGVCTLPGGGAGGCYSGVCLPVGCGNGVVEPGEVCDDGNTAPGDGCSARCDSDESCGNGLLDLTASEGCDCGNASLPESQRPVACAGQPNSDGAAARCTASCQIVGCGDGVVAGLEDCDAGDLDGKQCNDVGFYAGTLACLPSCKFDTSSCSGRCGDGTREGNETCDGADLGGLDCTDYGFYAAGGLACNSACGIDTSACSGRCNDGTYQMGFEACDPIESSDVLAARGLDCTDYGFYGADGLACGMSCLPDTSACGGGRCGDGTVNGNEDCDDTDLGGNTCTDFGYHKAGGLACRDNCTYDYRGCSERCGDGAINGPEQCDGAVPPNTDCTNFGFYEPSGLACDASCALVTTGCSKHCGDGAVDVGYEDCDGNVPVGIDCLDFGYYDAAGLACTGCTFDASKCTGGTCGDSEVQEPEQCESDVELAADCTDFGFYVKDGLSCNGCNYSTRECRQFCGDNLVNGPETCDGAPPDRYACTSLPGWSGGQRSCANACYDTTEHCHKVGFQSVYAGVDATIYDTWGVGDTMFAATNAGITRTTGGAWSPIAADASRAIFGWTTNDVFAVGAKRAGPAWGIRRFDGAAWAWTGPPGPPVDLLDVFGADNTVWAVGASGTVVRHANNAWTVETTTIPPTRTLRGVWASSATNVLVVGDDGARYHYNGTWNDHSLPTTMDFTSIWGRDLNEVYAATSTGEIHFWNGSAWSPAGSCNSVATTLTGIGGLPGKSVVVAVGYDQRNHGVICQLGGGVWHIVDHTTRPLLHGVGGSDRHLAVAGDNILLLSDGASWLDLPIVFETMYANDAWGSSASNLYIVGEDEGVNEKVMKWNGNYWDAQTGAFAGGSLAAITGGSGWSVAVGYLGRILASDGNGGAWSVQGAGVTNETLTDVWGDNADVYAVGHKGVILRRSTAGTTWSVEPGTGNEPFYGVWGVPGGPVFAVGSNSTVLRRLGGVWSPMPMPVGGLSLTSVAGRSATDVYVGGTNQLFHYDGVAWKRVGMFSGTGELALPATGGFLLDVDLHELIGGRWLPLRMPQPGTVTGGFALPDMTVVLRYQDSPVALIGRTWTPAKGETDCKNMWDDDGDNRIDCGDSDCNGRIECAGQGACRAVARLTCNSTYMGTTVGGPSRWPYYGGNCHVRDNTGPETYVQVTRGSSGPINVTLSDFSSQQLDLVVPVTNATGACIPEDGCRAVTPDPMASIETVSWTATAGEQYVVIVDGFKGGSSSFTLRVTCP